MPLSAAVDQPLQYLRPLGLELLGELGVALRRRDSDGERHQVEPPPHSLVDRIEAGLMIARDDELELRREMKKSRPIKRADNSSPPVRVFDLRLGPALAAFGLYRRHQAARRGQRAR